MQVRIAREQWHTIVDFGKYAANRPNIYAFIVGSVTYEQLRRPVPSCGNVIRVAVALVSAHGSCEAEVAELDDAAFADEQVFGLDVSVYYIVGV